MNKDRDKRVERLINLTLEILFRITGEDYTVVKKTSGDRCQAPVSEGWGGTLNPIPGPPPHPRIYEDINDQKILELTYKMIELLTGEVPIRCQDVAVYFSVEEWEYLEDHKDQYKDVMMEEPQPRTSPVRTSKRTTPERHSGAQDWSQDHQLVNQDEVLNHCPTTDIMEEEEEYVRGDEQCKKETPTDDGSDYSIEVRKQRAKFIDIKRGLRQLNLVYAMMNPTKLRLLAGEKYTFFLILKKCCDGWMAMSSVWGKTDVKGKLGTDFGRHFTSYCE
ncbi:uncharacterized protein LOC142312571 [Anomaloglossus baeobatrachus]|uniref:uncharacterized protein LOC142312571 n=1 Tax=Anomaloglossus baeobatrachus TaxID=238106 RepID=UPI003F4FEF09